MSKFIKILKIFIIIPFLVIFLTITSMANEPDKIILENISSELNNFKNNIPDGILDYIPQNIWNGEFSQLLEGDFAENSLINFIFEYIFIGINDVLKNFSCLIIILIISSMLNLFSNSFSSIAMKNSFSLASSLCVSITVFNLCTSIVKNVTVYLSGLCKVMESFAPLMASLYVLTGNVTSGGIASASLVLFISLIEKFLITFMLPIINICMCFSIIKSVGGYFDLSGFSKTLKNTFTGVTVFIMSIFMFVLSCKSILSQSTDSISIKTAKFAISSFIPIVGSTVNEALRTVTSSISLIKNSCGIIAIIVVILMILPSIVSLLLYRLLFNITGSISKCLKCENENAVIEEASSICAFSLSLVLCTVILFIFSLTILIKSAVVV